MDAPLRRAVSFSGFATDDSGSGSTRTAATALAQAPPVMRALAPYSGSDPARPGRNASLAPDNHRTVILRMAALAQRRPYGELPRYVWQS